MNPQKSFWAKPQVEYLGFLVTREGIKPQSKKIQGILNVKQPKSTKQVRSFIGMINYYRSLWPRRSKIISPLTELTGKGTLFRWEERYTRAFEQTKLMDTLLAHPDFNKPFDVHTDASQYQVGGVIS